MSFLVVCASAPAVAVAITEGPITRALFSLPFACGAKKIGPLGSALQRASTAFSFLFLLVNTRAANRLRGQGSFFSWRCGRHQKPVGRNAMNAPFFQFPRMKSHKKMRFKDCDWVETGTTGCQSARAGQRAKRRRQLCFFFVSWLPSFFLVLTWTLCLKKILLCVCMCLQGCLPDLDAASRLSFFFDFSKK